MGGYATWDCVTRFPGRFAAAAPICGGGDEKTVNPQVARVPVWAFHGVKDNIVPLYESRRMVEALKKCGGKVKFTVYPDAEHDSWTRTYDNLELYDWFLRHRISDRKSK